MLNGSATGHLRRQWLRPSLAIAVSVALASAVALGWMAITRRPSTVQPTAGVVGSVLPGSTAWELGVREGDRYVRWVDGAGGDVLARSGTVGVPDAWLPVPWLPAVFAVLLIVGAAIGLSRHPRSILSWVGLSVGSLVAMLLGKAAAPDLATEAVLMSAPTIATVAMLPHVVLSSEEPTSVVRLAAVASVAGASAVLLGFALLEPAGWLAATAVPVVVAVALASTLIIRSIGGLRRGWSGGDPASVRVLRMTDTGRRAMFAVSERERDRLAQRVHDRVLPTIRSGIEALEHGDPATSKAELTRLSNGLREEIMDDQLMVLREAGLEEALRDQIQRLERRPGHAHYTMDGGLFGAAPAEVNIAAYRVVQEALRNAERHSSAGSVKVTLDGDECVLCIEVKDDGIGISEVTGSSENLGLRAMREAAASVGARLRVGRADGGGTLVTFHWSAR